MILYKLFNTSNVNAVIKAKTQINILNKLTIYQRPMKPIHFDHDFLMEIIAAITEKENVSISADLQYAYNNVDEEIPHQHY